MRRVFDRILPGRSASVLMALPLLFLFSCGEAPTSSGGGADEAPQVEMDAEGMMPARRPVSYTHLTLPTS